MPPRLSALIGALLAACVSASSGLEEMQRAVHFPPMPYTPLVPDRADDPLNPRCVAKPDAYDDLKDDKIYALVYFGRREYIEILNAYLERNLRKNGGVIDVVLFAMLKYTIEDYSYLRTLLHRNPESYRMPPIEGGAWDVIWRLVDDPGAFYIKIDDDVTYIADGAIPELIREKKRGRFLFVSANVINHGVLSAVHQEQAISRGMTPPNTPFPWDKWVESSPVSVDPKYSIEHHFYSDCIWRRWDCAAYAHEAFLNRLEDGTSCAYDFGIFDFHSHGYARMFDGIGRHLDWNDNFFAFNEIDFRDIDWESVASDDEATMATWHPKKRNQHAAALRRAVIVHWSFSPQESGLRANSTLIDRYRALAQKYMAHNAREFYDGQWQPSVAIPIPAGFVGTAFVPPNPESHPLKH